ncbi:hypothetical protein [Thomasclavelia saccharogumia]|uniref:hypothetical protein n=2 Tax=Thomasclavelia saccharogumia TaxID=341225 RepID=UPI00047958F2|nr:hypothetical protein [Thomasclavelia saccharogumia]
MFLYIKMYEYSINNKRFKSLYGVQKYYLNNYKGILKDGFTFHYKNDNEVYLVLNINKVHIRTSILFETLYYQGYDLVLFGKSNNDIMQTIIELYSEYLSYESYLLYGITDDINFFMESSYKNFSNPKDYITSEEINIMAYKCAEYDLENDKTKKFDMVFAEYLNISKNDLIEEFYNKYNYDYHEKVLKDLIVIISLPIASSILNDSISNYQIAKKEYLYNKKNSQKLALSKINKYGGKL